MTISFKNPSKDEISIMQEFAKIIDSAYALLNKPQVSDVASIVASKLNEALMWYSHGILNKPSPKLDASATVADAKTDILQEEHNPASNLQADAAEASIKE